MAYAAMLVEFSARLWEGSKMDKTAGAQVAAANNSKSNAARVYKDLLGDCAELAAIKTYINKARADHVRLTVPWFDNGPRLLPFALLTKYSNAMDGVPAGLDALVEDFLFVYGTRITQQAFRLGDLFNANDYPSADALREKFGATLAYHPLPDAGDFRLDAMNDMRESLEAKYASAADARVKAVTADLWKTAGESLSRFVEQLAVDPVTGKPMIAFKNTAVSNVTEFFDNLEGMNLGGDPALAQIRADVLSHLDGVTPDLLRADLGKREAVRQQVADVLKNFW